jgi:hypothetical protein
VKTRVVEVTKGWVPQVYIMTHTTRPWFRIKEHWEWLGLDEYGVLNYSAPHQLRFCLCKSREEAEERLDRYRQKEVEEEQNKKEEDKLL